MKPGPGAFGWYELMTTDVDEALAFYQSVFGWRAAASETMDTPYMILSVGDQMVAGCMALNEEQLQMGVRPFWAGYVEVPDVDAATSKATGLGAREHVPPTDIPNVGRFSVLSDPQGALICLFNSASPPPPGSGAGSPGTVAWHELAAPDWQKAFAFYEAMFGWAKADAIDIGPMGVYQLFSINGEVAGGMFNKPEQMPLTQWLYYVQVDALGDAMKRVETGGGQILYGPMEVPGGSWIAQCMDPQGAAFAMVSSQP